METSAPAAEPMSQPADPAWDEAFLRVQSYLRAYGLESPVLLSQTTNSIIEESRSQSVSVQGEPVEVAMDVTHARIATWLSQTGFPIDKSNEQIRVQGRLALIIADLPRQWANHFLSPEPVPPNLAAAMASVRILPGPEMRPSSMAPEPLEFGILEPGDSRLPNRRVWVPVRVVTSWLLIFCLFGFAWAATH
jgi:hypothetical protein